LELLSASPRAAINLPPSKSQCTDWLLVIEDETMRIVSTYLSAASVFAAAGWLHAAPAASADLPSAPSSYPALGSGAADAAPDPWAGLSVGAGISVWGGKGVKGGVGGETDLSYEHVFDNGIMLGVQASTGYMPYLQSGPGFSQFAGGAFAGGSAIVGYNFGRVTPYVITGVDFVRPTRFGVGAFNANDAINSVFSGPGAVQAVGTLGVGVNYQITSNFSMGVEAIVHTNPGSGPFAPWP
jgi:opacity protein-like surface antigen